MILQIRGTSGTGKSTVVRRVMEWYSNDWDKFYKEGRRQPLFYRAGDVIVLGHYEIACGGCDTIGSAKAVYETLVDLIENSGHVRGNPKIICEGLLLSEDVKWSLQLDEAYGVKAVFLTTSREECLRRVEIRQAGRKPIDPERVDRKLTRRIETIERARLRLVAAGVTCKRANSDQAVDVVKNWITS